MEFKVTKKRSLIRFALKPLLFSFILLFTGQFLTAQEFPETSFKPNLQIGVSAGTSLFFGDIKQNKFWPLSNNNNEWRFAYGMNFNYNFSPVFMFRVQGLYGKLSGSKRSQNIWFENDYYEINFNTVINFNNLFGKKRDDRLINLFGTAGFGILNYNSVVKRMDEYYVLKRIGYGYGTGFKGRDRRSFLMLGAGININVNRKFAISLESTNKYAFTDLLDGVESGNHNDVYNYTSIGVVYRFAFLKKPKNKPMIPVSRKILDIHSVNSLTISEGLAYLPDYSPIIKFKKIDDLTTKVESEEIYSKIEFRVQILAEYRKPYPVERIRERYNVPVSEISEDVVNRYYVYTIGSFPNYSQAKTKCEELKLENGISGAFVVAFRDGKRIFPVEK